MPSTRRALGCETSGCESQRLICPIIFPPHGGRLALIEIPPGGRVHPYCEETHDENLFVLAGNAAITAADERFYSWVHGLNVLIPCDLPHAIINRSSVEPLVLLSLLVYHEGEDGDQP